MTKAQIIEALRRLGWDAYEWENKEYLRGKLTEARASRRQHYGNWNRIFRATAKARP